MGSNSSHPVAPLLADLQFFSASAPQLSHSLSIPLLWHLPQLSCDTPSPLTSSLGVDVKGTDTLLGTCCHPGDVHLPSQA